MANELIGNWKCVSNENFDEFLKKLGVGFMPRKIGSNLKPNIKIEFNQAENKWSILSESSVKTSSISFEINKEFEEETFDGKKVKSTASLDGSKMVHTQIENGKVLCIVTREVNSNGEQVVILKADDVIAYRIFQRA
jgi:fatty acid-binding protein 3